MSNSNLVKIEKIFNEWKIFLILNNDSIIITIENKNNSKDFYQSSFNLKYFHSFKLLEEFISLKEIIEFISILINKQDIKIEDSGRKLILKSNNKNIQSIELLLENKLEKKIIKKEKIQLTKCNLTKINSFKLHNDWIRYISIFPSGNLISVSNDRSIKIFDINFNFIQIINDAHNQSIIYVSIKNENNFVTCSIDKTIRTWIKKNNNKFEINQIINNCHDDIIYMSVYCSNDNLISCSNDGKIKIWEKNNKNKYELITVIKENFSIRSLLLLKENNYLIAAGDYKIIFFNLNNFEIIKIIKEDICYYLNSLKRIDENRIILGGNNLTLLTIISISEKKIIKTIKNDFICWAICVIEKKGIFITAGYSKDIKVYRSDNYECIQIINNAHFQFLHGIIELNDNLIGTYGHDTSINIWKL